MGDQDGIGDDFRQWFGAEHGDFEGPFCREEMAAAFQAGRQAALRPGDAEALAAYRKVYEDGNRTILHLAECGKCNPVGYDREFCRGYDAALRADIGEARRVREAVTPWAKS